MTIYASEEHFVLPKIQGVIGGERCYILTEDYCYEWSENGNRYRRTVFAPPATCAIDGTGCETTNLASVPGIGEALGFDAAGPSDGGSVIHDDDYLRMAGVDLLKRKKPIGFAPGAFQILTNGAWVDCHEPYTRLRADKLYRRRCILGGMPAWKATVEFLSLRVGAVSRRNGVRWYFS